MKKPLVFRFCLFTFAFSLVLSAGAQNLTVREIMREPSIAGMRPEAETLSPDGEKVIFAWSAAGREPRDLYITETAGRSQPRLLVDAAQNFEARAASMPESKLNYGLNMRDDFVKDREKNLFGVNFSPDSKRILFLQNSDIYVLEIAAPRRSDANADLVKKNWKTYEAAMERRADLTVNLVKAVQLAEVNETSIFEQVEQARAALMIYIKAVPVGDRGDKTPFQKQSVLQANEELSAALEKLRRMPEANLKLRSNETFFKVQDEMTGVENRIAVARLDYNEAAGSSVSAKPRRITRTQNFEGAARWIANDRILYSSGGNYFVINIENTALVQVTREANQQTFQAINNVNPSRDGLSLAYAVSDGSRQRALFTPNYLDEFVQTPSSRRGFTEQKVFVTKLDGSLEKPFEIKLPKAEGVGYFRGLDWAADNRSLIVDRVDSDLKRRQLFYVYNVGGKDEQIITITEERDEKWIAPLSGVVEPHPTDAGQLFFGSERGGFNHLYLAILEPIGGNAGKPAAGNSKVKQENPSNAGYTQNVQIEQLTNGNWQTEWAKWMPYGGILYSSTEAGTAERQIYELNPETKMKTSLAKDKGMITGIQLSESPNSGARPVVLYEFSTWNQPTELYAQSVCPRCRGLHMPQQLTKSAPENFLKRKWNAPTFVDIPTRDGKVVKTKAYFPADFDKTKKYPAVFFVHGAGYLQNTINGWNNYYREFMFNQMLTDKGYVVLDIDYRGSAGYGRDWRTDVHDFLGGKDYEDHLDAIDYAVKNYAVDEKRIGVYGGSYGGFMAGMLVMRAPEKIAAAAALRPVFDWKNYFASSPVYTLERLGFPDKNGEAYRRSSPIAYAENLQKPLLILHGLVDDNVPAQDSIQLIEKLMRLEKSRYFEAMLYPSENHAFTRATSWADEYERIFWFFEKHLKN